MDKKHHVHNLIILDESGSMESIKTTIIQGFNEVVQTIKGIEQQFAEQEHFISLVSLTQNRWTFTYIGADHDVEKIASLLSINNTLVFEKNETDIKSMFVKERRARTNYSKKIRFNEETSLNYFENSDDKNI